MYHYIDVQKRVHRILPSKFPPVSLFDWAENREELEQIAALEGLTNDRLSTEYGKLNLVPKEDWVGGQGATPLMAAFTHIGYPSRFSDETFGIYYAADSQKAAIKETVFHRELFYSASNEPACKITMREYVANVVKPLVDITGSEYHHLLNPNPNQYKISQAFGKKVKNDNQWGIYYPSVRSQNSFCAAILRPPALTIPVQGKHFEYLWDGHSISQVKAVNSINF
ncbi:RES family NAD+ phosphorylase [Legionella londiniensis]|uniref:RES domain-containing protein n=1 Tax=Legionella londiniensis TaxID=45068 RepID=A0A0W0VRW9_9GAMM|nr:RES family NAD+ phosphorylase [Legionella londiniensis]KTD22390.1 RES domain-containing protein [Legionella londiniensis]STX93036.1 RES domain-containing protein [Legionella londiniensis]